MFMIARVKQLDIGSTLSLLILQMPTQLNNQKTEDIPLCCCKIDGTTFEYQAECTYCQALDSIDGKVVICQLG